MTRAVSYPLATPEACSIARTLDILGDTWSVLVIREMFLGTHRFDHDLADDLDDQLSEEPRESHERREREVLPHAQVSERVIHFVTVGGW